MDKDYMTVTEAAEIAGVTTKTIARHLRMGRIKGVKLGGVSHWRIDPASFEAFMRGESADSEGDVK